ncbi:MinD/ParA family ATP-binding protein [Marinobacter fonticola]|uniref:MinD/ParA family ATP-binding protein n=1 Tax=Marinobacter fonticola TaxID=2603215 RepID=UPI0011E7BDCC|nr:AAA family ATPase [Marinobacter fonticola]
MKQSSERSTGHPRILAVTGGKGGVGKTSVALNLALVLARQGNRVLLLDGDTDLANVTIMLGQYPGRTLEHVLKGECSLEQAIFEAPFGLHVLAGASGVERCMGISPTDRLSIFRGLAAFEKRYDYILIDTAAGLQANVIHMIASAAMACVVVTPDPTSLTDAFSLIKVLKRRGYRRTPSVLVNMAQGASQARSIFQRFSAALQRHVDVTPHYLGAIWRDETLRQAVSIQRPVALLSETDPSCRQFRVLADMLMVRFEQIEPRRAGFAAYWNRLAERKPTARPSAHPSTKPSMKPTMKASAGNAEGSAPVSHPSSADNKEATLDPATRWHNWSAELEALLQSADVAPLQRYEAVTQCFVQLGKVMDEDMVEMLQTGLASMQWEQLPAPQRRHFATHLRDLAGQIDPDNASKSVSEKRLIPGSSPGPRYDEVRFGTQDALLRALQDQPEHVSLDAWLDRIIRGSKR